MTLVATFARSLLVVVAYRRARSHHEQHMQRYSGLLGPWRLASDQKRGIAAPVVPPRPPLADWLRAAVAATALMAAAVALLAVAA